VRSEEQKVKIIKKRGLLIYLLFNLDFEKKNIKNAILQFICVV